MFPTSLSTEVNAKNPQRCNKVTKPRRKNRAVKSVRSSESFDSVNMASKRGGLAGDEELVERATASQLAGAKKKDCKIKFSTTSIIKVRINK